MKSHKIVLAVGAALVVGAQFATAQTGPVTPAYQIPDKAKPAEKDGPRAIDLAEGVGLSPYFNLGIGRDSNLFLTQSNAKSSDMVTYNPGLKLDIKSRAAQFGLGYDLKAGQYSQSTDDNYTDYKIFGTAEFVLDTSTALKLAADRTRGHDPRGSNDRGLSSTPDEFRSTGGSALFAYGANAAKGRVEVEAGTVNRRYTNNRSSTAFSDRDTRNVGGRFFFKIAPKTALVFEARQDNFDYVLGTSLQDSKENRYLAGITWEATAATSGTIKVGRIKKDFAVSTIKDFSSTGWEASVEWKPSSYSKINFYTTKSFSESTGLGDFTLNKKYGTSWEHGWDSRLKSVLSLSRSDDEFVGNVRNDKTTAVGFKVNYKLMRWMTIGGEVNNTKRDSNSTGLDYTKNLYMLTLGLTL